MTAPEEIPAHDQLADEYDDLGWDRELHGLMLDAAAPAPETLPYDPATDPFLTGQG